MAPARQLGDVVQAGGPPGAAQDTRGSRIAGALARVAFGLLAGLLLAEAIVRLAGLEPEVAARPRMLESPSKTAGLECYPDGRTDPAPVDLRDPGQRLAEAARTGLHAEVLAETAERTPHCVRFTWNEDTRRDASFAPAPTHITTVLMVGDSFTEGSGVERERTFVARLDSLLGPSTRVLNGGRRGLDQPELVGSLERLLPATRPDVVLYALTLNDFEQDPAWADRQLYLNDLILDRQHMGAPTWKLPPVLRRSALARLLAERRRSLLASGETVAWYAGMTGPDNAGGWARTRDDLARMARASEQAGARFVVAILPLLVGLDGDYPFAGLHADVTAACGERGIEVVDVLPALSGRPASSLWVHRVDMHPNAEAHRLIAEALAPALRGSPRSADPAPPPTAP
jgi:lysophospholipase L1-like esterase